MANRTMAFHPWKPHIVPKLDIQILHATSRYAVISKPGGMLSVPGKGEEKADCAAARVRAAFPHCSGPLVVHRLDMDTSGVMVFGLDPDAQRELSAQFESRIVHKHYIALVQGVVVPDAGTVSLPLRADIDNRPMQIVDHQEGREAITNFTVLSREIDRTRIRLEPITGRTHQLRVHAATSAHFGGLGHAIIGDVLYGSGRESEQLCLHAAFLSFLEPGSHKRVEFIAPPPF
jgi:tRNA pseudouridine32 synthase/23S rRNA pseudouridine746 synthase